jgi:hypothetical protein
MFNIFDYFTGNDKDLNHEMIHNEAPIVESFKQYFSSDTYDSKVRPSDELLRLDIEILSLFEGGGMSPKEDLEYVAKFLSNFCKDSENYKLLSKDGKEKLNSIFDGKPLSVREAVKRSNCAII